MPARERPLAIGPRLTTLQEAIKEADARTEGHHTDDYENVAQDGTHDGNVVPLQVQFIVLVAPATENLTCLDNLGCQAVTVDVIILAVARLDELWRDSQERQVSLLLLRVSSQDF